MVGNLLTLAAGMLDLLSPPRCAACALPHQPHGLHAPHSQSWAPADVAIGFCPACGPLIERPPPACCPPARHAAACLYQGPLADAIRRFKYQNQSSLQPSLAPLLTAAAAAYAGQVDIVVPIPLHARKLRQRGWNPAALLARPVARTLGVPMRCGWLRRIRETAVQAGLSREARLDNVRGAFHSRCGPPVRVLLVDDVRTTGATLLEAACCLEQRGHDVKTLALAWALHDTQAAPDQQA